MAQEIAQEIRDELVCCDMYELVQRLAETYRQRGQTLWEPDKAIRDYHAICHWGECAARVAEQYADRLTEMDGDGPADTD